MAKRTLTVDVLPELTARLDAGESRDAILGDFDIGPTQFAAFHQHWLAQIGHKALKGDFSLARKYSEGYQTHLVQAKGSAQSGSPAASAPRAERNFDHTVVASDELFGAGRFAVRSPGPPPAAEAQAGSSSEVDRGRALAEPPLAHAAPDEFSTLASELPPPVVSPRPGPARAEPPAPAPPPAAQVSPMAGRRTEDTPPRMPGAFDESGFGRMAPSAAPPPVSPAGARALAEPPMAPGYRNVLGSLPPRPVRPDPVAAAHAPAQRPAPAPEPAPAPRLAATPAAYAPAAAAPAPYAQSPGAAAPAPYAPPPAAPAPYAQSPGAAAPAPYAPPPAAPTVYAEGGAPPLPPLRASWESPGGLAPVASASGPPPERGTTSPFGSPRAPDPQGPAPWYAAPVPAPRAMPAAARLSLEQIASIQAELDVDPARSQAVFASNGIDAREYENQMRELEARLRANAHEAERFEQLRGYYRAILGPRH